MSERNPREIAAEVLARRGRKGAGRASGASRPGVADAGVERAEFTETLLERALAGANLTAADRRLCQELVYGAVRWQAALDWLIARKTKDRAQNPGLRNLLRLGLYQIFWLDRIPDHAAVNETVELARQRGFGRQAGFVNAVLRGYLREFDEAKTLLTGLKTTEPAIGWSHPAWLVARWQQRWDAATVRHLLEWNNTPPKNFARVNTLKTDAGRLLTQWREEGVEYDFVRRDWFDENLIFQLKAHPSLSSLASFQQGLFYVQDPSTLLAVRELDPQSGEAILDCCAAPGGKTTFIAQLMADQGRIVAQDASNERLKLIEENCARLGVRCVNTRLAAKDADGKVATKGRSGPGKSTAARRLPSPTGAGSFDRVLLDVPCSNTGVLRRRVDARWRLHPPEISQLRAGQLRLLHRAADAVKPGGILVYSTCSLEPEENSEVVEKFLAARTEYALERRRELLPFTDGVDGAFVARLRRGLE